MNQGGGAWTEANELLSGKILLLAPHMDDCVLGCGGTLAQLSDPGRVHVAYATDGALSPEPPPLTRDRRDVEALVRDRAQEARNAMELLGVPASQVHFVALPDGRLKDHLPALLKALSDLAASVRPDHVLCPFRFDRHPDHLAVNRCATELFGEDGPDLLEYFVYHRSRLLPKGDIREYVRPQLMVRVDVGTVVDQKRAALRAFRSQTTLYYDWQTRPNLTPTLIEEISTQPEVFLRYDRAFPQGKALAQGETLVRMTSCLEPRLKRRKDQAVALLRRWTGSSRAAGYSRAPHGQDG